MNYKLRLPQYFSEKLRHEISELYASVAIADFALAVVSIFEPIFLYSVLHLSVPQILLLNGFTYFIYIFAIPFGARVASKYGYKHGILFSIPFQILFWVFLYAGQEHPALLLIGFFLYGIEKALYWPAFHASVARFASDQQRGREFSVLYAIVNVAGIAGPFIGGILSQYFGVRITFIIASAVYALSFVPLFATKEIFLPKLYEYKDTWELYKTYPSKFLGYVGFGEEMLLFNMWPIYIYVVVRGYEKIGALVTAATLIATVITLYIGKITDQYSKRVLIRIGALFYSLFWFFRISALSAISVFFADSFSRTSKDLVFIPLSTITYERAEATHILPYAVFFEQSLSIGKLIAAVLGALLFYFTGSFVVLFIVAGLFSLLYMLI
jgi:MFS family permease